MTLSVCVCFVFLVMLQYHSCFTPLYAKSDVGGVTSGGYCKKRLKEFCKSDMAATSYSQVTCRLSSGSHALKTTLIVLLFLNIFCCNILSSRRGQLKNFSLHTYMPFLLVVLQAQCCGGFTCFRLTFNDNGYADKEKMRSCCAMSA